MKLNYRPEIDGLRSIAVFAVVLYHADFFINEHEIFKGGFIGVDIFFVISGYLITSLIYKGLLNNKFSLKEFYIRRIRRIFPILLVVILCCIPVAYFFYLPSSLDDFLKSLWSTLFFSSNFYFFHTGLIYGGPDASLKPLLHTWSLSVEEQFYIIFPIFFILFYKLLQDSIFKIILFIFFLSLISTLIISIYLPNYNFYFLNVRIWELLAGSIVSIFEIKFPKFKKINYTKKLPLFGFFLIILSIFFLNDEMSLPSIYTIPSITGVCLIIFFSNNRDQISNILSSKNLVFFGLISYSLYLWHYPIFAFYDYIYFYQKSNFLRILLIICSIIISIASYHYIEKPFRNKLIINNKYLLIYLTSILSIIVILSSTIFLKDKVYQENVYDEIENDYGLVAHIDTTFYITEVNQVLERFIHHNSLNYPFNRTKKNVLVVGNSHAEDFFLILKTNLNFKEKYNIHLLKTKILYDFNEYISNKKGKIFKYFTDSDIIIFSNRWSENDIEILDIILKSLINENKEIILLNQNINLPSTGKRDVTLLDKFIIENKKYPNKNEINLLEEEYFDFMMNDKKRNNFNNKLQNIANKYKLKLLDKSLYQCNYNLRTCDIFTSGNRKINYNDNHHTLQGIKFLGERIYKMNWLGISLD
jgi:peptidoglycan/LPS O-acetylase OafA/YrhL